MQKIDLMIWNLEEFKAMVSDYFKILEARRTGSMFKYYPFNLIMTKLIKPDLTVICEKSK